MITIQPYKPTITAYKGSIPLPAKPETKQNDNKIKLNEKNVLITGAIGIAALATAAIILSKRPSAIKTKEGKTILNAKQVKIFKDEMKEFAADIDYRKDLLTAIGLKKKDYAALRPIVGPEEYKNILKEFSSSPEYYSPGKSLISSAKDGFDMSGKENGTFRANMHVHTVHSDGRMTVQELLDQAAQYADKIAEKVKTTASKAKHAPFTIAITDHDTVEGAKEAVKIISNDPWKYRNLRVILGCELSVENKSIPQRLKSPIATHTLLHGINPFDEALNSLLDTKKTNRINLVKEIIRDSAQIIKPIYPDTAKKLQYDDAKNLYPVLKHGLTHVGLSTKDYIQFRTIFSECFEKNQDIQSALKAKGINTSTLNYKEPKEKYFNSINENFGDKYWKKYAKALTKYSAELLGISEDDAAKKIVVSQDMENIFEKVNQIAYSKKPKNDLGPAFIDMDEGINLIKNSKYGYIGIAHPGLTDIGDALEYPFESMQAMSDIFKKFKAKGGDRALFAEVHYHYYGNMANDKESWLDPIANYTQKAGLYQSGGLDSHGKSIFYSGI